METEGFFDGSFEVAEVVEVGVEDLAVEADNGG